MILNDLVYKFDGYIFFKILFYIFDVLTILNDIKFPY